MFKNTDSLHPIISPRMFYATGLRCSVIAAIDEKCVGLCIVFWVNLINLLARPGLMFGLKGSYVIFILALSGVKKVGIIKMMTQCVNPNPKRRRIVGSSFVDVTAMSNHIKPLFLRVISCSSCVISSPIGLIEYPHRQRQEKKTFSPC